MSEVDRMDVPERWWIIIARSSNSCAGRAWPTTSANEAARWEGKGAHIVGPLVTERPTNPVAVDPCREALERIEARCARIAAGEYGGLEAAKDMAAEARTALAAERGAV